MLNCAVAALVFMFELRVTKGTVVGDPTAMAVALVLAPLLLVLVEVIEIELLRDKDGVGRPLGVDRRRGPVPSHRAAESVRTATGKRVGVPLLVEDTLTEAVCEADDEEEAVHDGVEVPLGDAPAEIDEVGDTAVPVELRDPDEDRVPVGVVDGILLTLADTVADAVFVGVFAALRDEVSD